MSIAPSRYQVRALPEAERPRERLQRQGAHSLSSAELIAVILGSGTKHSPVLQIAQDVATSFATLRELAEASLEELCLIKGLGMAKAIQLKAALSLGLRVAKQETSSKHRVDTPLQAYHLVRDELEYAKEERLVVILQDVKGCVICHETIALGTLSNILIHPREVFYPAIRHKASSMVLVHNHPSGDPTPSQEDYEITETLIEAGNIVGIPINDHLVIGQGAYISIRQKSQIKFM